MKIGELASATDTPVETIRYYERQGLLPAPERSDANYRLYGTSHVERLSFIRHCRSLDMTLDEIRKLLRFCDDPTTSCDGVNDVLDEHIGHIAQRIHELRHLEGQLKALRSMCSEVQSADRCCILKQLAKAPEESASNGGSRPGL